MFFFILFFDGSMCWYVEVGIFFFIFYYYFEVLSFYFVPRNASDLFERYLCFRCHMNDFGTEEFDGLS